MSVFWGASLASCLFELAQLCTAPEIGSAEIANHDTDERSKVYTPRLALLI